VSSPSLPQARPLMLQYSLLGEIWTQAKSAVSPSVRRWFETISDWWCPCDMARCCRKDPVVSNCIWPQIVNYCLFRYLPTLAINIQPLPASATGSKVRALGLYTTGGATGVSVGLEPLPIRAGCGASLQRCKAVPSVCHPTAPTGCKRTA
jgi:hypothetical protein